ncbi:dTMP kinase [Nitrospira defluvii]|nr:dTMP kinase [Nitrospira defluvii]
MQGHFITFEGGEGSGKSTQLVLLADYLQGKGRSILRTREPGGTQLADQIRELILGQASIDCAMDAKTELFLYLASRAQHVSEVILPALKAGKVVLCDRFTDATLAYQGEGRGLSKKNIEGMALFASRRIGPGLTFLLQINVKKGLARLQGREDINRMDEETLQFHEAVKRGYEMLAHEHPKRIVVIDADDTIEAVAATIREKTDAFLS